MMKKVKLMLLIAAIGAVWPIPAYCQGYEAQIRGLNGVLDELYQDMLPLCEQLISVGRGIAAFAAIFYIGHRVWRHIAAAEPVDFYPLLRPFVIGFAILMFPSVIALINGVLSPAVRGTSGMVTGSDKAIALLLKKKEDAIKSSEFWEMYVGDDSRGNREKWLKYMYGDSYSEGFTDGIANDIKFYMAKQSYNFRNSIKAALSEILRVIFEAAALCINTIRTFYLIVLAIIGPLAFGIAVFDGFQFTLTSWIARYINVFLWLPVANIFGAIIGKIQEKMIAMDIRQIESSGDTFFNAHDMAYLIFLIIGIVGYFSVPSVAGYIIHAGGPGALLHRTNRVLSAATTGAAQISIPTGPLMTPSRRSSNKN